MRIPEHIYQLLMSHAFYDKELVEKCIKLAVSKNPKVTTQDILDEIWSAMEVKEGEQCKL